MKNKQIYSIVRGPYGERLGVVAAIGPGVVGFSKVHPGERFDKKLGLSVAIARAFDPDTLAFNLSTGIPDEFKFQLERITRASHKYFAGV